MTDEPRWLLDSSFFINGWQRYPLDLFGPVWGRLSALLCSGRVHSCDEVYREIEKKDDDLFAWVKPLKGAFDQPDDAVTRKMREVMRRHPNFVALAGTMNRADPWIIAHASITKSVVVTDEQATPRQSDTKPPKIPNVCDEWGIRWADPLTFIREARLTGGGASPTDPPGSSRASSDPPGGLFGS